MFRLTCILAAILLTLPSSQQALLRSNLLNQADTSVICTLQIRQYEHWDRPTLHYFKRSTATYLLPGDYAVYYYIDTLYLHAEWIHVQHGYSIIGKNILTERIPLSKAVFVRPKSRPKVDDGTIYLDF